MLPQEFEMVNKFNKLFEYYFQKKNNITDKDKNYILTSGFDIMNKIQYNDIVLYDDILSKLIILFPNDVSLYSKMGLLYKPSNIQKSILWHTIGFNIDPTYQENTIHLCSLYFENGMGNMVLKLNQNNLFDKFINNDKFLGIYARCNFQNLHYKNGISYLMKLIENTNKIKMLTNEQKLDKWKNYQDAGYVFVKMGEHIKAIEYTRKALELSHQFHLDLPKKLLSFSNLLFFGHFHYNENSTSYDLHTKINDYYPDKPISVRDEKILKQRKNTQEKSKIYIGYVSGDYTYHPIANFMIPILQNHDKTKFEIFLYSNQNNNEVADLFLNLKVNIHYILHKTDGEVAELIKSHKIDILFDLSGHSVMNRLGIFSYNPSPIQITYLGYPNTSGLKSIHYRITDHMADHKDTTQKYSETLLRLPKCFLFYKNVMDPVAKNPKKTEKTIILGAINKEEKNSKYVMYAWKEILKQCPNTKILIKLESFDNNEERMVFYTTHLETTHERIILVNKLQNKDYNELFTKFDILLDTFPYSGTTTTCNTLHSSVPVVTLYHKDYHVNNVSASLLINSSVPELVAYSIEEYISIVKNLVNNPLSIDQYKKEIGVKFLNLMQAKNFIPYYENTLLNVYNKYYYNTSFQETNCLVNHYNDFIEKSSIGYDFQKYL
jgi:predicted O-linked N-acetylglucosamine transferase (SPINDLY family)